MSAPRLVATDLDGTLVRTDGTVSARSRAALARVEAAGARLVIVTGRPPRWMGRIAEQTGHAGVALVSNGAGVFDLATETLLDTSSIPVAALTAMVGLLEEAIPDCVFAGERASAFLREPGYLSPYGADPSAEVVPRQEIVSQPLLKLLVRTGSHDADSLLAAGRAVIDDELGTLTHSSAQGLLEISAAGVSKASALARLAEADRIEARDVIAFGDMPNDAPMLSWAGRSWAVADAHPLAREAAGAMTASNDDDGVALVLEQLFPG